MSKLKHTPGPWVIGQLIDPIDRTTHVAIHHEGATEGAICLISSEKMFDAQDAANARAIAALPEMIEACELLIAQYDAVSDFKIGGALTNEPFLKIKAILNQATGGNLRKPVSAG